MLSEAEGCEVLLRVFKERGFTIARNAPFDEDGVEFIADGWDAWARVGFEYLTHEAGDHLDLDPDELAALEKRIERGELFFFIIDEKTVENAEDLTWAANKFLDEVQRRRAQSGGAST